MKYSLAFRVWHWLSALVVLGLIGTVLLRWTLLAKSKTAYLLKERLDTMGITITDDQAITLVKALRVELWEWHIILGFLFGVLVVFRLYLHFVESKKRLAFSELGSYRKLLRASYCALYAVFGIMAATGLILYFSKDINLSRDIAQSIKNLHEFLYYYIAFFIPLHIVGVFLSDATKEQGLVSSMIHGKDRV